MTKFKSYTFLIYFFVSFLPIISFSNESLQSPAKPLISAEDLQRLKTTQAINMNEILFNLNLGNEQRGMTNPYTDLVLDRWASSYNSNQQVCAIKFTDSTKTTYNLKTFDNRQLAEAEDYVITHDKPCGACSTLKDLAIYIETPDLTTPVRACAMNRLRIKKVNSCLINNVGFTELCSQAWAFNSANTKKHCFKTCFADYGLTGFLKILLGRTENLSNTDEEGNLRPCIQCDEDISGPGFKYSAGRTRRNSGITSAIERPGPEISEIDHQNYFDAHRDH